jgi:hypothetical protein
MNIINAILLLISARARNRATSDPTKYIDEKTHKENDERQAIIDAVKKLSIPIEGRDLNDIAQDIVKATSKKEYE